MNRDPAELQPFLTELSLTGPIEPFLVFADWLMARGDPWGELIAMQCQPRVDQAKQRVLELTGFRLLDQIADELCPHDSLVGIAWQRGFVSMLAFSDTRGDDWVGAELARLFALPAVALCDEVSFAGGYLGDRDVRGLLRVRDRLRRISRLDFEGNWFSPAAVTQLQFLLPQAKFANQRGEDEERPDRGVLIKSWDDRDDQ